MRIKYPIIVEGKYDKIKLDSLFEATVITTGGFEIFNSREKELLIKRLASKTPIILLTDSDGGGHLIRSHIKTILPPDKIINLYVPRVEGKEKRKSQPSKEGILGVEGIDKETLISLLKPFSGDGEYIAKGNITKVDFFKFGLSGGKDSKQKREKLLSLLNLPTNMTANAMLSAVNIFYSKEEIEKIISTM
ncbi:MAG: DUF4093 domain-containing protein [Clostridia bacterium]|nr:DUF4093 domain-containing protein [Clostridia bacterium]